MKSTRKLVYSATATAIAVLCIVISHFLPLSFTPLMAAGFAFFIALSCGYVYGFLAVAATLLLGFFITAGVSGTFLLTALIFAPYSVLAFFLRKLTYATMKGALIRIAAVVAAFNGLFALLCLCFAPVMLEYAVFGFSVSGFFDKAGAGAYAVIALVATALMIGYDYLFLQAWNIVGKRLKMMDKR